MNLLFHSKFNLEEIKQVLPSLMCHPQYTIIKQSLLFQNLLKESEEVLSSTNFINILYHTHSCLEVYWCKIKANITIVIKIRYY